MAKRKIIHFMLQKEDGDLIRWKAALPPRSFNRLVNEILIAESKHSIAEIPCAFSSAKEAETVNGRLVITDPAALNLIKKMKKGQVTEEIKQIIRKHIGKNAEIIRMPEKVRTDLVFAIFDGFKTKIEAKEKDYVGVPDKYRKLCESYELAMNALFQAIRACCNAEDSMHADSKLLHLDYEKIIDDAFDAVFGETNFTTKI